MFILFLIYLGLCQQEDFEITELEIEKEYEFLGVVGTQRGPHLQPVHFYSFHIEYVIPDEDVFVVLKAKDSQNTFPSLYLSQVNEYPSLSDELCGNTGLDVCVIEADNLIENTTYYLGVYCIQDCHYELQIHYEQEETIQLGEAVIVTFNGEIESVLRIQLNDEEFDRVIIRAHFIQDKGIQLNETFHFYINEGNEVPSTTHYDYEAEEIWSIGKGVVLYETKNNGNLTILLLGVQNTRLYFVSLYYPKIREIGLFERVDDLVTENKINYYKLIVQQDYLNFLNENSLSFDIHPFDGNPDIYVNPCVQSDQCNQNYSQYIWQSQLDQGYESMTISSNNRIQNGNSSVFMIAISGQKQFSSYSFVAYLSNYFSRILTTYAYESGFLIKDELAEYIVDVFNQSAQTFSITTTFPNGQGIIILKKCIKNKKEINDVKNAFQYITNAGPDNFYNCSITNDQINNIQLGTVLQSGTSELHASDQNLQFFYNKTECETDVPMLKYEFMETNCEFVFGIYSYVDIMHYQIFIKGQEQHIELLESIQYRSFLMEYDTDLFKFNAKQQQNIEEVVFQISVINGEYEAFSSRTEQKPDQQNYDSYANLELDVIKYQNNNLNGMYYIRVIAKTLLRYTITPIIHYKNNNEIIYIPLKESIPHTHLNTKIEQITNYTFELHNKNLVFIHLNSIYGHFICQIINQQGIEFQPSDQQFQLLSSEHTLIIDEPKQYFYLSVKSLSLGVNESYEILYTTELSLVEIFYGDPLYTYLEDNQQSFYYYQCQYQLEQLFIILSYNTDNNKNNNLQIYVSIKSKYPNPQNYDYHFTDGYITLQNIANNQIVYIGIYSKGLNEFSLLIRGKQAITELQDDIIQQIPIPSFEQYHESNLYYIIPKYFNGPSIQIQAYTDFTEIELLCNIQEYNNVIIQQLKNQNHSIFPSKDNYQLEEELSNSISNKLLLVQQQDLLQCQNYTYGCILLITVKLDQVSLYTYIFGEQYNNITTVNGQDGYFSIVISSSLQTIRNGEMILGFTGENIMSYYYFEVDEDVQFIQITVRPIDDGDPDLYVKKQINDTILFPTLEENDFNSLHYKSDFLLIKQEDNKGKYVIGVAGFFGECMFELLLNYANIQMYYISEDQLINQHINQTVYYFYQHIHKESFRILLQGIQNIDVAINTYSEFDNAEGLYNLLPYEGTDVIQFNYTHNNNLFGGIIQIQNNNTQFCYYCTYIIALKPIQQTDMSLLIAYNSQPLTIEYGQIYYDQCLQECKYQLKQGDLSIIFYQQQTNLQFYLNGKLNFTLNMTKSLNIFLNDSYILLINTSQFILILNDYQQPTILQLGKVFNNNNKTYNNTQINIYMFTFIPLTIDQWYTLNVNSQSQILVEMYYISKQTDQQNQYVLINPVQEWSTSQQQQELKYQLPSLDYQYKIKIQCNDTFNILLNVDGLKYIDANLHYIEQIQSIPQQYSIYGVKGQELQIEKIDCLGKTEINITNYQFDNSQDIFFNITPFEQVGYFKNGISLKKNVYSIVPHLQYSHDQWYLQNGDYDIQISESIHITIQTMKRNKTGVMNPKLFIYQLHFSNQIQLLPAFGCQMDIESLKYYTNSQLYHSKSFQTVNEEDTSVTFTIQKPDQDIYGLVVFQVFYENHTTPYTYFYQSQLIYNYSQIQQPIKQDDDDQNIIQMIKDNLILILGILGSLILIGILVMIFVKYKQKITKKKVNKQMDEEQEQVKSE